MTQPIVAAWNPRTRLLSTTYLYSALDHYERAMAHAWNEASSLAWGPKVSAFNPDVQKPNSKG